VTGNTIAARRIAAETEHNAKICAHIARMLTSIIYILASAGFHKNNIELIRFMTEGIQPAMADSFVVKLEERANLTENDVATFNL
jgi:RNA binding exosome subunit